MHTSASRMHQAGSVGADFRPSDAPSSVGGCRLPLVGCTKQCRWVQTSARRMHTAGSVGAYFWSSDGGVRRLFSGFLAAEAVIWMLFMMFSSDFAQNARDRRKPVITKTINVMELVGREGRGRGQLE